MRGVGFGDDAVVAIHARDFFDQVVLDANIRAMARDAGQPAVVDLGAQGDAQARKQGFDFLRGNIDAKQLPDARMTQANGGFRLLATRLADRVNLAAADLQGQLGGALKRQALQARIDAALEAVQRIGIQLVAAPRERNRMRCEAGAFQEDAGSASRDSGFFATHHAGQGQWRAVIGDQ